jgi:hypothetical protein
MDSRLAAFLLILSISPSLAVSPDDQAAREEAARWVIALDRGQYGQAYREFAPRVRTVITLETFQRGAHARRWPLGSVRNRSLLEAKHLHRLNGNPDGDYQDIAFKTSFERKSSSIERIVLTKETGHWQILGYKIY